MEQTDFCSYYLAMHHMSLLVSQTVQRTIRQFYVKLTTGCSKKCEKNVQFGENCQNLGCYMPRLQMSLLYHALEDICLSVC